VSSSSDQESYDDGEDDSYSMDDADAEEKQLRQLEDFTKGGDSKHMKADSKVSPNILSLFLGVIIEAPPKGTTAFNLEVSRAVISVIKLCLIDPDPNARLM
jgi:hypothetical protein